MIRESHAPKRRILKDFNGLVKKGELLLVLGRPGSGCSTMLKTLSGELHGLELDKESSVHYNGMKLSPIFQSDILLTRYGRHPPISHD
jgi:ABC-type multidrug transport system ATPase subunit